VAYSGDTLAGSPPLRGRAFSLSPASIKYWRGVLGIGENVGCGVVYRLSECYAVVMSKHEELRMMAKSVRGKYRRYKRLGRTARREYRRAQRAYRRIIREVY
jgi:hypothetical protein